jgi:2-aminoadipate transaminase
VFVPGDTFYASTPDSQTLRMNFSNVEAVKMKEALQVLAGLI